MRSVSIAPSQKRQAGGIFFHAVINKFQKKWLLPLIFKGYSLSSPLHLDLKLIRPLAGFPDFSFGDNRSAKKINNWR